MEKMVKRDCVFNKYKKIEDLHEYKNIKKNLVNNQILKEKYTRKIYFLKSPETKMNEKWKTIKKRDWSGHFCDPQPHFRKRGPKNVPPANYRLPE